MLMFAMSFASFLDLNYSISYTNKLKPKDIFADFLALNFSEGKDHVEELYGECQHRMHQVLISKFKFHEGLFCCQKKVNKNKNKDFFCSNNNNDFKKCT
jgi:hypothetical protein